MKKGVILAVFIFAALVLTLNFVSAASPAADNFKVVVGTVGDGVKGGIESLRPLLEFLLGPVTGYGDFTADQLFFAKLLIVILLMSLIWAAAKRMPLVNEHDWVIWMMAVIIPLLGVRFFTPEMVLAAAWPTSALAIAVLNLIVLVFLFSFVEFGMHSRILRKISWAFIACIFLGIYLVRFSDLDALAYIYIGGAVLSITLLILDGTFRKIAEKAKKEKTLNVLQHKQYMRALKDRDETYELYVDAVKRFGANSPQATTLKNNLDNLDDAIDRLLA